MPHTWGEDDLPLPRRQKGRHHRQRGRSQYRPVHKRRRGCGKAAAGAALLGLGVLGGVVWGGWLALAIVLGGN